MPWDPAKDPLIRARLAEVADLEWQCTEQDFHDAIARGEIQFFVQPTPHSLGPHPVGGVTMSDNKTNRGEPDRSRISLSEDYEVRYWSEKFGVTADALRNAVAKVGNSPEAVQRALGK